jgi:hypothetical protein
LEELPEKKLRELGFNLDRKFKRDWHQFPSKKIYVALEYEGPAWQKWLAKNDAAMAKDKRLLQTAQQNHSPKEDLKDIQERIDNLISNRETESHLFPVEVALDAAALRAAYPDRARVAIVPALLEVNSYLLDKKRVYNSVLRLLNDGIHVDQAFRPFFLGLKDTNKNYWDRQGKKETVHWVPRYQATLAFGKRFEPWLAEVEGSSRP